MDPPTFMDPVSNPADNDEVRAETRTTCSWYHSCQIPKPAADMTTRQLTDVPLIVPCVTRSAGNACRRSVGLRNGAMRCRLRVSVLRRTRVTRPLCTVTRSGVAGDQRGARSCVAGLPVTVGCEPRSDAIGIRRTPLARFIRRLEENTLRPTNGHHDGCPWPPAGSGSDHLLPGRGPSA